MPSFVTYTGNGATTAYPVLFGYLNKSDVAVTVNNVSTAFTWIDATNINISPAPANGTTVKIARTTPITLPAVDFTDGATLQESDLDVAIKQLLYKQQELQDTGVAVEIAPNSVGWDHLNTPANSGLKDDGSGAIMVSVDNSTIQINGAGQLTVDGGSGGNGSTFKNRIINGDMDVWQRGTSFSVTSAGNKYAADRWKYHSDATTGAGTATVSRVSLAAGTLEGTDAKSPTYSLRIQQTAAATLSTPFLWQEIEDVRTLAGEEITVSFYAKVASGTLQAFAQLDRSYGSGGSATETVWSGAAATVTTTWQRFSWTTTVPSLAGKTLGTSSALRALLVFPLGSTFDVEVRGVQVEAGASATAYDKLPLDVELRRCQRYYLKSYAHNVNPGTVTYLGAIRWWQASSGAPESASPMVYYPTELRIATGTVTIYNPATGTAGERRFETTLANGTMTGFTYMGTRGHSGTNSSSFSGATAISYHFTIDADF